MKSLQNKKIILGLTILMVVIFIGGYGFFRYFNQNTSSNEVNHIKTFTKSSTISDAINNVSFEGFGNLIFPVDRPVDGDTRLDDIDDIYIWYNYIDDDTTVDIVNSLKEDADSGNQVFYPIYSDEEMRENPDKKNTGLFFFRGEENAKTAVVNAGGGFMYVGAMQDSFPHALALSKMGYNAFALIYRPGSDTAMEDLARAIAFLHEHKEELKIDISHYSVWGGSAGGRMTAWISSYGTESFGEKAYPRPAAAIIQYTGLSEVTGNEVPTCSCVGTSDGIADYRVMEDRIERIKENDGNYFDDPDFRPFMTLYDVPEGTDVKGAMLVSPGGAFLFRSEIQEGVNVAKEFARLGYVSFVVHYRVDPYTEEESGIDIARAVKYVRSRADEYGFQENHIGLVGFSAGGIANGHAVLEFNEKTNGTAIDNNYQPDKIDRTSSTPNAVIMGYSFYGRLSVADLDEDTFRDVDLPPTYYVYGTEDPFYNQFNAQVDLLQDLNKDIEVRVLDNYPHGFGIGGDWAEGVSSWLERVFE